MTLALTSDHEPRWRGPCRRGPPDRP